MNERFHGKILLFGEYTVITGSQALVIPLRNFSGCLRVPAGGGDNPAAAASNRELVRFFTYLAGGRQPREGRFRVRAEESTVSRVQVLAPDSLDLERMGRELDRGMYFDSSIPQGYGAGSSAALVAAVYHEFASGKIPASNRVKEDLPALRNIFSRMESKFHGTSSGIDPVCCYTGQPVLADGSSVAVVRVPEPGKGSRFFLLDTGIRVETGPLVTEYRRKMADDHAFASMLGNCLVPLVRACIADLFAGRHEALAAALRKLSRCQLENFRPMIPEPIGELWRRGLEANTYTLKLCGSGGGGFYLGYAEDWKNIVPGLEKTGMGILPLEL